MIQNYQKQSKQKKKEGQGTEKNNTQKYLGIDLYDGSRTSQMVIDKSVDTISNNLNEGQNNDSQIVDRSMAKNNEQILESSNKKQEVVQSYIRAKKQNNKQQLRVMKSISYIEKTKPDSNIRCSDDKVDQKVPNLSHSNIVVSHTMKRDKSGSEYQLDKQISNE